ncbi:MAG: GatB/YqeY domain-containing protein [Bacteroidales bacterium]|nr:GatB/YqeY domain-containing protein [Bacteroidales bacterium]MCF8404449.1 GatB/YqeY domain-containing protein [Bacteroidales bacterium]
MSLEQEINSDIKKAMLEKEKEKLVALRAVKAAILLAKTDKGSEGAVSEEVEMSILKKLVKQRRDAAELYQTQNRTDLAEEELFQLAVIEKYLPEQLNESEVRGIIKRIIEESGASSMKDMGKVMGIATKQLSGKADNKMISLIVRESLGN